MCEYRRLETYFDKKKEQYDFEEIFSGLGKFLKKSNYVVANLETPLAGKEYKYSYKNFSFNTPSEFAEAMLNSGIKMVTTANNHVLDRGIGGLRHTIQELDRIGIEHTGSFSCADKAYPLIKEIDGIKIAFLSYTYGTEACFNHNYLKRTERYCVNLLREQELRNPIRRFFLTNPALIAKCFRFIYRILSPQNARKSPSDRWEKDRLQKEKFVKDIEFCRTCGAEYIILCLHCGGQFNKKPTEYTRNVCAFARKNGVDFVIGNHEHCIQMYDEKNQIAYSLGNLTSDYAIERGPFDRLAEYSILFHLYLKRNNSEIEKKCAFSIVKSVKNQQGKIVSRLVSDIYENSNPIEKDKMLKDVRKCIQIFLDKEINYLEIKDEYQISEFF